MYVILNRTAYVVSIKTPFSTEMIPRRVILKCKNSILYAWLVVGIAIFFYTYEYMIRIAPNALESHIKINFEAEYGMINNWYYIPYVPLQLFVGSLMDYFGSRVLIIMAVILCLIGLYIFGYNIPVDDITLMANKTPEQIEHYRLHLLHMIYFGRFLIGFGSAFGFVAILKVGSVWLPKKQLPLASAIGSAVGMGGNAFGQKIISHISLNYSHIVSINVFLIIGIILLVYVILFVREKEDNLRKRHSKKRLSMLYKNIYEVATTPQIWICGLVGAALWMPVQILGDYGSKLMPLWYHITGSENQIIETSQTMTIMVSLGFLIGAPISGFLATRFNKLRFQLNLSCFISALWLGFLIYFPMHNLLLANLFLFILGLIISSQVLVFALSTFSVQKRLTASAVALTNMIVMLPGLLESYFDKPLQNNHTTVFSGSGAEQTLLAIPVALFICFLLTFLIRTVSQNDQHTA